VARTALLGHRRRQLGTGLVLSAPVEFVLNDDDQRGRPRKGRPLEAVLETVASEADATDVADRIISTLRYEKAITKGDAAAERRPSTTDWPTTATSPTRPSRSTLFRDDRDGMPRRVVFDSLTVPFDGVDVQLVGREEPFRALRKHEFALGFDSADLVLEEVVQLREEPLTDIADINDRIDPVDTDVRVVTGMGDTVYHAARVADCRGFALSCTRSRIRRRVRGTVMYLAAVRASG